MFESIKSSAVFQWFQRTGKSILKFLLKFLRDWSLNFAGMLAYSLLVALVPMAIAFIGILGLILKNYPNARQTLIDQISNSVPGGKVNQAAANEVITLAIYELTLDADALVAIGIVLGIFGASRLFAAIDSCLTIIYRVPQRPFLRRNLMAFGMVLLFIGLMMIMMPASIAPSILVHKVSGGGNQFAVYLVGIIFVLLAGFTLFEAIYLIIPNKKMLFKNTWCGALVAACLLVIVLMWFPVYVEDNTNTYTGAVGFGLLFILFLYYFSIILLLGAQINAYCFEHYQPFKTGLGTCISEMHDKQGDGDSRKPLIDENAETIPLQYQ